MSFQLRRLRRQECILSALDSRPIFDSNEIFDSSLVVVDFVCRLNSSCVLDGSIIFIGLLLGSSRWNSWILEFFLVDVL